MTKTLFSLKSCMEEGEETCMEVLQTNMILHDIAQIMQLITESYGCQAEKGPVEGSRSSWW